MIDSNKRTSCRFPTLSRLNFNTYITLGARQKLKLHGGNFGNVDNKIIRNKICHYDNTIPFNCRIWNLFSKFVSAEKIKCTHMSIVVMSLTTTLLQ